MYTTIQEATEYIINRRTKTDLAHFKEILDTLQIPYDQIKTIHVTGTNGKGSTINYIRNILTAAGYKVGTFTSPYIICHQDRFCIDGKMMAEKDFIDLVNQYYPAIEKYQLSMFECDVLFAFVYFYAQHVDYAIIEVGIGGREDKTNMIHPLASIITNVGQDHLAKLGPTLEDVAYQKAGIIKDNTPVFIGKMPSNLTAVIAREAKLKNAPLIISHPTAFSDDGCFDYLNYKGLTLNQCGSYQIKNACLALDVVNYFADEFRLVDKNAVVQGLKQATWPGRFEHFNVFGKDVYLDGAHNIDAFNALFEAVDTVKSKQDVTFIYAALRDKAYMTMAKMIREKNYHLHVCQFVDERALSQEQANEIHAEKFYASIDEALLDIKNIESMIVVCGSLHFISQFRAKIVEKNDKL